MRPVAVEGDVQGPDLVALLGRGDEMLLAILDPFHRPAELSSAASATANSSGIDVGLRPEAAADVGRDRRATSFSSRFR